MSEELADTLEAIGAYNHLIKLAITIFLTIVAALGLVFYSETIIIGLKTNIEWAQAIAIIFIPAAVGIYIVAKTSGKSDRVKKAGGYLGLFTWIFLVGGFWIFTPWSINLAYEKMKYINMYGSIFVGTVVFCGLYLRSFGLDLPKNGKMEPTETPPRKPTM